MAVQRKTYALGWDRERVAKMGQEIEEEAAARRKRTGAEPFGAAKILAQDPWTRPERVKKSPAPLLHAASKAVRQVFYEGFALFVAAYLRRRRSSRGESQSGLSAGLLPAGVAVRGRVGRRRGFGPKTWM
jgi:hypothetical protein